MEHIWNIDLSLTKTNNVTFVVPFWTVRGEILLILRLIWSLGTSPFDSDGSPF